MISQIKHSLAVYYLDRCPDPHCGGTIQPWGIKKEYCDKCSRSEFSEYSQLDWWKVNTIIILLVLLAIKLL
jgi:hypothetical protein